MTIHLVGPGEVGRAFLRQLVEPGFRVVAVSDRSGTIFDRDGVDLDAVLACKQRGDGVAALAGAESIPTELSIRLVSAAVVVDATPSHVAETEAAVLRARAALQTGASLVLCSKNGLARAGAEWLRPSTRHRIGIDAVLGGTGAQLVQQLDELRDACVGLALVGNATTTAIIDAVERGASIADGIAAAREKGLLEPDAELDLDGTDAAVKLLAVWSAVFGDGYRSPALGSVLRQDVRGLDERQLRERHGRGATTRLVARGNRVGELTVAFEEVAQGSPLAAPADRVVYGYELPTGLRVHTGVGVGFGRTAEALWSDVRALAQEGSR